MADLKRPVSPDVKHPHSEAVVESKPQEKPQEKPQDKNCDPTSRALEQRIRQQEILAELGVIALRGAAFDQLLADTARLTAEGLDAELCKVLEHLPDEKRLLIRAGVGWGPGVVGVVSVGDDLDSPAGFALRTGKPVISNHLASEERFRTPEILQRNGVRRAMNVILQGDGKPFGVLEVDSRSQNDFEEHDIAFLQGAANLVGMAIERERYERQLKAALARDEMLLQEMNHRVKNSLAIVASMLSLQAREVGNAELVEHLNEASRRVEAIARAHDQLSHASDLQRMDVGRYIEAVCKNLDESVAHCEVDTHVEDEIEIATDRAISTALILNELVTNAAKYAYRGGSAGKISIGVFREGESNFAISVRDYGAGMPQNFDPGDTKGLGIRLIKAFAGQLNATIKVQAHQVGTEFLVIIPLE